MASKYVFMHHDGLTLKGLQPCLAFLFVIHTRDIVWKMSHQVARLTLNLFKLTKKLSSCKRWCSSARQNNAMRHSCYHIGTLIISLCFIKYWRYLHIFHRYLFTGLWFRAKKSRLPEASGSYDARACKPPVNRITHRQFKNQLLMKWDDILGG